jgi:hypothetical protein
MVDANVSLSWIQTRAHRALWVAVVFLGFYLVEKRNSFADDSTPTEFQIIDQYRIAQGRGVSQTAADLSVCVKSCQEDKSCKSFNYNKTSHTCTLASDALSLLFEPTVTSGLPMGAVAPSASDAPFYLDCVENQAPVDPPTAIEESDAFATCNQGCFEDEACVAFGYDSQKRMCAYYASLTGMHTARASILGLKHQLDVDHRHDEKECRSFEAESADQGAPHNEVNGKSVVVLYNRCLFHAFKVKLLHTQAVDPNLVSAAKGECESIVQPLHKVIMARTGSRAFADRMIRELESTALRNLSVGLLASYFESATEHPNPNPKP